MTETPKDETVQYFEEKLARERRENEFKTELVRGLPKPPEEFVKLILEELARGPSADKKWVTESLAKRVQELTKFHTIRSDVAPELWCYFDGIYVPHGNTFVMEFCRQVLGKAYSTHLTNEVADKVQADTFVEGPVFFGQNLVEEIPAQNGILNLKTRRLRDFSPDSIFFSKIPVRYDPFKDCPSVKRFLRDVLKNEDDLAVMQELFGFLLWKNYFVEKAVMLNGGGRNGKSKTIGLMKRFLGPENVVSIPLQAFEVDNFAQGELLNKMANLAGDVSPDALHRTARFKQLTGRDRISAARKYLGRVSFENYAKMIFACNELPWSGDKTVAFFSRWVCFDFPYTFVSKETYEATQDRSFLKIADENILDKITTPDELSGLLNWAIEGLHKLLKNGDFTKSKTEEQIRQWWESKSDSLAVFFRERVSISDESHLSKGEFKESYLAFCKEAKARPATDPAIKKFLENQGIFGVKIEGHGYWNGINLKQLERQGGGSEAVPDNSESQKIQIKPEEPSPPTPLSEFLDNLPKCGRCRATIGKLIDNLCWKCALPALLKATASSLITEKGAAKREDVVREAISKGVPEAQTQSIQDVIEALLHSGELTLPRQGELGVPG